MKTKNEKQNKKVLFTKTCRKKLDNLPDNGIFCQKKFAVEKEKMSIRIFGKYMCSRTQIHIVKSGTIGLASAASALVKKY